MKYASMQPHQGLQLPVAVLAGELRVEHPSAATIAD